jgi:hypothetical protein
VWYHYLKRKACILEDAMLQSRQHRVVVSCSKCHRLYDARLFDGLAGHKTRTIGDITETVADCGCGNGLTVISKDGGPYLSELEARRFLESRVDTASSAAAASRCFASASASAKAASYAIASRHLASNTDKPTEKPIGHAIKTAQDVAEQCHATSARAAIVAERLQAAREKASRAAFTTSSAQIWLRRIGASCTAMGNATDFSRDQFCDTLAKLADEIGKMLTAAPQRVEMKKEVKK